MATVTLITGGVRSGKSSLALELALQKSGIRIYIATAEACDGEMKLRIEKHRKERGSEFTTVEAPRDLAGVFNKCGGAPQVAVVDCLTVWLGNMYHYYDNDRMKVKMEIDQLVKCLANPPCDIIVVTNEVGWGIVPDNAMARDFRDDSGYLNRRIAESAGVVYLCVCGIAQRIK